ncbi:MAG: RNA 2',3'-cyclic phosphodiesterase [bacterium]|nr:RNA 2',3'-cyclic phosphodiesterase [Gammaproteobacteria bacterium]HIL99096.1 RNA 2',3'-cyclic phosphodiesterase [Pseudomonadales bacterium]
MRLFFGLSLTQQTLLEIDAWRESTLPPFANPVPIDNLHITLAFLGKVTDRQLEPLMMSANEVRVPGFELTLNDLGYWSKPNLLWIGPSQVPRSMLELAGLLGGIRRRLGLQSDKKSYSPHITIARRCGTPPPVSALAPEFTVFFASFVLFESVRSRSGLRYEIRGEWGLEGRD